MELRKISTSRVKFAGVIVSLEIEIEQDERFKRTIEAGDQVYSLIGETRQGTWNFYLAHAYNAYGEYNGLTISVLPSVYRGGWVGVGFQAYALFGKCPRA